MVPAPFLPQYPSGYAHFYLEFQEVLYYSNSLHATTVATPSGGQVNMEQESKNDKGGVMNDTNVFSINNPKFMMVAGVLALIAFMIFSSLTLRI